MGVLAAGGDHVSTVREPTVVQYPTVADLPAWEVVGADGAAGMRIKEWVETRFLECPVCDRTVKANCFVFALPPAAAAGRLKSIFV